MSTVPILIPAYEPDERLNQLLKILVKKVSDPIVIVDDGSGDDYHAIFKNAEKILNKNSKGGGLLSHIKVTVERAGH